MFQVPINNKFLKNKLHFWSKSLELLKIDTKITRGNYLRSKTQFLNNLRDQSYNLLILEDDHQRIGNFNSNEMQISIGYLKI